MLHALLFVCMQAQATSGGALRIYRKLWDTLENEFDVEPTKETQELVAAIKAACGLTAGVTAALRRRWNQSQLPPQALKAILTSTARKTQGTPWNRRTGYGVLDAKSALDALLP